MAQADTQSKAGRTRRKYPRATVIVTALAIVSLY
jgi:hypothetical protein